MNQSNLNIFFDNNFLLKHARRVISDPFKALIELVANSWDAGADWVKIIVPDILGEETSIEDNGLGLTKEEFEKRWNTLYYNRLLDQGKYAEFYDKREKKRKAYGRHGIGRHAMFCFSSIYYVKTTRNGISNTFKVKMKEGLFEITNTLSNNVNSTEHGTKIWTKLIKKNNFVNKDSIFDLIGSKFIFDPEFQVFINDELVTPKKLENLMKKFTISTSGGEIEVELYNTKKAGRTTLQNGIAWWVNNRLVGEPSWRFYRSSQGSFIDGRKTEAKQYTFVVHADLLEDDVKEDWSGFEKSELFQSVYSDISDAIFAEVQNLFAFKRNEIQKNIFKPLRNDLKKIGPSDRNKIGRYISELQEKCPNISDTDLKNLTVILVNLEKSSSGYELLDQLSHIKADQLDELNDILKRWSIREAKIVLNELQWRLEILNNLIKFVKEKCDELHDLQPIFEKGLWIFGPEFDSPQFTSNQTISTIIKKIFNTEFSENIRDRPDFFVIPEENCSIGVYSSLSYDNKANINGYRKIVILELKRGLYEIKDKEMIQGLKYARLIRNSGQIQMNTLISVYVLGTSIEQGIDERTEGRFTIVTPLTYDTVLNIAHARTFNLIDQVKKIKEIDEEFKEETIIKEVMNEKNLLDFVEEEHEKV